MRITLGFLVAVSGSAWIALSLTGSTKAAANPTETSDRAASAALSKRFASAGRQLAAGQYLEAREGFLAVAALAQAGGSLRLAAESFNNAGTAAVARQDFRHALPNFLSARQPAEALGDPTLLARTMNNIASVYIASGHPDTALQVATAALATARALKDTNPKDKATRPVLEVQVATALSRLNRFSEALPIYRDATDSLLEQGDFSTGVRVLSLLADAAITAGALSEAEPALDEALWTIRMHHLPESSNVLRNLARVRALTGDNRSAATLFDAALRATRYGNTPQWLVYADRGEFRLSVNDLMGALADFREARRLISLTRADVFPADHDRVAMESGLSRVPIGLAEAANRMVKQTSNSAYLAEAFDAAEQDRMWSLRALVPSADDWRRRLPQDYWDLLARYQTAERLLLTQPAPAVRDRAAALGLELQHREAAAKSAGAPGAASGDTPRSALEFVQQALSDDTVLFSFMISKRGGWLWAVDRNHAGVYPIPDTAGLEADIGHFAAALRESGPDSQVTGAKLYRRLFGAVPASYLAHKRWLLEPDGPLFDLPFAALVVATGASGPEYLAEKAAIQAVPGALLIAGGTPIPVEGEMLAVGDAVYNAADARFSRTSASGKPVASLPRLPETATELRHTAEVWGPDRTRVLTGDAATLAGVEASMTSRPAVIHFATHVVASPDDDSSGLIALSLDRSGAMGLLGPAEIVARPVSAALIVMNGCHSGQGKTLAASGLMGLTRAWLGAGAGAVLATRWDIPDAAAAALTLGFYRELRSNRTGGPAYALQRAQIELLKDPQVRANPVLIASYFLIGRV